METVDNSLIIVMFVLAIFLLVFFIIYLVKYLLAKRQIKAKNKRLYALTEERNVLQREVASLRDDICGKDELLSDVPGKIASLQKQVEDANALTQATTLAYRQAYKEALGTLPDVQVEFTPSPEPPRENPAAVDREKEKRAMMRRLEESVLSSLVFHRPSAGKNDLSEVSGIDRRTIDATFKEMGLDITDYLDRFRVDEAIPKLLALKNAGKKKGEEVPEEEDTKDEIAQLCGFDKVGGLNRAVKRLYGMTLDELYDVL